MKKFTSYLISICIVLISNFAFAAPVPATYDNPAWSSYIEDEKFDKIPDGMPTGRGAVSRYYGTGFWPENFIQIDKPYDLSTNTDLVFSESAKINGRIYASETMRNFLIAVSVKFQKLINDSSKQLPIQSLFYAQGNVPMRSFEEKTSTVSFGVYVLNGTSFEPVTDVRIHGEVVSKNAAYLKTSVDHLTLRYQNYQKLAEPFKTRFAAMSSTEFRKTTQELLSQANEESQVERKSSITDLTSEHVKLEKQQDEKAQKEIAAAKDKIDKQYESELDALRNQLLEDLSDKEKEEVIEKIRAVEMKKRAELKAIEEHSKHGSNQIAKINPQERKAERRNDKRLTSSQKRAKYDSASTNSASALSLDEKATWLLIEAIMTQTDAAVSEIRMPLEMKLRLANYASKAKRNKKVIEQFLKITTNAQSGFEVSLACSARDRFLGCLLGGSPETEDKINHAASAMLKSLDKLTPERQMEIIQIIVNANPVELDYIFDTLALRKRYNDEVDKIKRTEYRRLLTELEDIPIKNESAATRYRRLSKLRGSVRKTDESFDAYFDDYLDDFTLEDLDESEKLEKLKNESDSSRKKSSKKNRSKKK